MADIFISYSSKDKAKADQLSELLVSAGLSVWIDQAGLEVASSWSSEIVEAINNCKAFIVLLSLSSLQSHNVMKEVSLASEKRKKILPLDLEPVQLTKDFEYQLAGIQRTSMSNIDSIIRALGKLGLEATQAPTLKLVKETDGRKSLMILPFEDLSPTGDNGWFADGVVSEMISSLSHVKSLKVTDAQTTKEFKNYKGHLTVYAKEMGIRYFVQGDVRKFGDNIKITSRLLDLETGEHLWQDSLKGTMDDIFDIQEKVAQKVVEGLKVYLPPEEKIKLTERGTENAEAYELYLKAVEYYTRHTKSDYELSLTLLEECIRLDPQFLAAHALIVNTTVGIYRLYSRTPALLDRASEAAEQIRAIEGDSGRYAWVRSMIALRRGDFESSVRYAKQAIEINPDEVLGYVVLGFAYKALGNMEGAISARKETVRLSENDKVAHFNLLGALYELSNDQNRHQEILEAAANALPVFERHIRLNPDDYNARVQYVNILQFAGRRNESLQEAEKLSKVEALDGVSFYNLACLYLKASDIARGLSMLSSAIRKGYQDIDTFRSDPDLHPLRSTPEFKELMKQLEEKIANEKHG